MLFNGPILIVGYYEDEGTNCPGGQDSTTFPQQSIIIFSTYETAVESARILSTLLPCRKNPTLRLFSSSKEHYDFGLTVGMIKDWVDINAN